MMFCIFEFELHIKSVIIIEFVFYESNTSLSNRILFLILKTILKLTRVIAFIKNLHSFYVILLLPISN